MALTTAQRTTLKNHIAANTNTVRTVDGQQTAINTVQDIGDNFQFIADWYNSLALAGDNQPIAAPLNVWKPSVGIMALNSAIDWTVSPTGATAADVSNSWLKWQTMCLADTIDLTDPQVRQGIVTVWGSGSITSLGIGAIGKQAGTRLEVLLAGPSVGGGIGLGAAGARVSQVFGQRISGPDVADAKLNG